MRQVGHLSHVPDSEAAEGRELGEGLHAERLAGNQGDDGGIAGLDELGRVLSRLAGTTINLQKKISLGAAAGNQGNDGGIAGLDEFRRILSGLTGTTINLKKKYS